MQHFKSNCAEGLHFSAFHYDSYSRPGHQLHSQSPPGKLAVVEGQRNGKLGHSCMCYSDEFEERGFMTPRSEIFVHLGLNVSSSAHNCGGVHMEDGYIWQQFEYI